MNESPARTRLHLLRHGLVDAAWRGRLYGSRDVPLSDEGRIESRAAADLLAAEPLAAVVSSGLARTEFAAALLRAGRDLPREDDPDLREIDRGDWVGLRPEEVPDAGFRRWHADPERMRPPGGENLTDVAARALPRLDALAARHPGATVAVVAHSWILRVALCHALELPLARAARLVVRTGALVTLDWPADPAGELPVVAGLGLDRPPAAGTGWFRGPAPDGSR